MSSERDLSARRPNVLLITADQFRWDAIAAHGDPAVATPNLDRLAASGTSFRRAYSESPVCVPARAALLTGRLPHETGVVDNDTPLVQGTPTFVRGLRDAGYETQAIGKMHFEPPRADHGFERMWLSEELPRGPGEDEYLRDLLDAGFRHVEEPHGIRHELYYVPQVSQLPERLHTTAWTGRRTVEFLEQRHDRPFFCWTSFIKPHPPFDPPAPWYRRYDPLALRLPIRLPEELARLDYHARLQHRFKWTTPEQDVQTLRAYYYASVSFLDEWVGRILDALERLGLREDTLVVFTADHGEYLGDHHRFGKRGFHDAAARLPLVLSQPGRVPGGVERHDLVGLTDLAPTLLDGEGLLAPERPPREVLLGQFSHGTTGLYLAMDAEYKYVYSAADDRESLFRVGSTLDECQDLAGDPLLAGQRDRLRETLLDRFARDAYTEPLGDGGWRHFPPPPPPRVEDRGLQFALWR